VRVVEWGQEQIQRRNRRPDVTSDRAVVIAVDVPGKTPLVGEQKRPRIVPAAARIAGIDRWTADDQRMGLGRTTVILQGTEDLRYLNAGHDVGRPGCEAGDT
jgi:hypothetical protein